MYILYTYRYLYLCRIRRSKANYSSAKKPSYQAAKLPSCQAAKLPSCQAAKPSQAKPSQAKPSQAKLPSCQEDKPRRQAEKTSSSAKLSNMYLHYLFDGMDEIEAEFAALDEVSCLSA